MEVWIRGLACCFLLFCQGLSAQRIHEKGRGVINLERHQVSFNLLMPSFRYEIGLFRNVTAMGGAGIGLATPGEGYSLSPAYFGKARYYHNLERRKAMGKNVSGNSGNFFGLSAVHFFTQWQVLGNLQDADNNLDFGGAVYGLQRTLENGIHFDVEAGAGWYFRNERSIGIGPFIGFTLGWTPTKRKPKKPVFD